MPPTPHICGAAPPPTQVLSDTAALFGLLSVAARLHILWQLASGEQDLGTLAETTGHRVAAVSHHLGELKLSGAVRAQRAGRRQVYVVANTHAVEVVRLAVEG